MDTQRRQIMRQHRERKTNNVKTLSQGMAAK
jgi:hypothetical protein